MADSSKSTISPLMNLFEFKYTISTSVDEDLVTICATAFESLPTIFSPRIELVSKARPDGKDKESKVGELVL